jgi:methyl-galactoside transport system substrate-binding protein
MKIGISIYNQYDTFISGLVNNLLEEAKLKEQKEGITITLDIVNAGGSQVSQNYQVDEFIKQGYDILCINLVDRTDASIAIDMAMNADIPIIFFNRELVDKDLERWDQLFYVGAVALESGIMQGQIVVEACEKDFDKIDKNRDGILQYVILEGEPGHQDSLIRTEYVMNTITESGIKVEKLGDEIANWNRAQGETRMSQWLKDYDDQIEIIISNNDDMALGAIDAMKKANISNMLPVVGIDGTTVGLEAVKNGEMIGTVLNDDKGQANSIIELAYSLAFQEELPDGIELIDGKYIRKPHIIVTPENIDEIIYSETNDADNID